MPIYEYDCRKCGHRFEHFARSFSDKGPGRCPECGCRKVEKAFSVFASSARGSGSSSSGGGGGGCGSCGRSSCAGCRH